MAFDLSTLITAEQKAADAEAAAMKAIEQAVQALHDAQAQQRGYDDINSCGKYCGFDNDFRAECEALGAWVAACWSVCYSLLAQWEAGTIEPMGVNEVLAAMPVLQI